MTTTSNLIDLTLDDIDAHTPQETRETRSGDLHSHLPKRHEPENEIANGQRPNDLISDDIDAHIPEETHHDDPNAHPSKRTKLEAAAEASGDGVEGPVEEEEGNNCSICLHSMEDRTVIPNCSHEFCFECLVVWTGQSRRCPLCNQPVGEYVIHSIRSRFDYRKHFLPPLKSASPTPQREQQAALRSVHQRAARQRRERRMNRQNDGLDEADRLERSILKRRWIYEHDLYAKHVGSNPSSKYKPHPTPSQFTNNPDLISRTTSFLRRELHVWEGLDVEFLTNLIISLMKSIDIRSEAAVKLLAEFLDMDAQHSADGKFVNAEHFAHEVYCYIRSPYKDLFVYDTIYDAPPGLQPPSEITRRRRWDQRSDSRSPSPSEAVFSGEASRGREPDAGHMIESHRRRHRSPHGASQAPQPIASTSKNAPIEERRSRADDPLPGPSTRPRYTASSSTQLVRQDSTAGAESDVLACDVKYMSTEVGSLGQPSSRKGKGRELSNSRGWNISHRTKSVDEEVTHVQDDQETPCEPRAAIFSTRHDNPATTHLGDGSVPTASRPTRIGRDRDLKSSIRSHLSHLGQSTTRQDAGTALDKGKDKKWG